jgi:hypothetical protein
MRTGVAHLRSLPPSVQLDLGLAQLSPDVLTTPLLHEIIHHVCANSAVNVAMQYRWLELLRLTLSAPAFGYGIYEEYIELAADLAAAEAVLQPLGEGIAHFAEFDCAAPNSKMMIVDTTTIGVTDALLWRLLSLKGNSSADYDDMFRLMQSEQLNGRTIARKTDVLCNPFYPSTGNDCYLLGYLVVKSLWNRFADGRPAPPLRPTAFLDYVLYYFYEDWGLAQILMAPGRIPVERVLRHFVGRLKGLLESDIVAKALAFKNDMRLRVDERGTLRRGPEEFEHGPFKGLDLTDGEVRAGLRATWRFYQERVGPNGFLTPEHATPENLINLQHHILTMPLPRTDPQVLAYIERNRRGHGLIGPDNFEIRTLDSILEIPDRKRAFCHLIDLEVNVRGRDGRELLLSIPGDPSSERVLPTTSASRVTERPQQGRLFGVLATTDTPSRFYCFLMCADEQLGWLEPRLVCGWSHGSQLGDRVIEVKPLISTIAAELQMEQVTQLSFVALNDYFLRDELAMAPVRARADDTTRAMGQELRGTLQRAGWTGLIGKPDNRDFGLRKILPKMSDVRSVAAAGLCNAFTTARTEVDELMQGAGFRLSDAIEASKLAERRAGVTLIRRQDDHVLAQI